MALIVVVIRFVPGLEFLRLDARVARRGHRAVQARPARRYDRETVGPRRDPMALGPFRAHLPEVLPLRAGHLVHHRHQTRRARHAGVVDRERTHPADADVHGLGTTPAAASGIHSVHVHTDHAGPVLIVLDIRGHGFPAGGFLGQLQNVHVQSGFRTPPGAVRVTPPLDRPFLAKTRDTEIRGLVRTPTAARFVGIQEQRDYDVVLVLPAVTEHIAAALFVNGNARHDLGGVGLFQTERIVDEHERCRQVVQLVDRQVDALQPAGVGQPLRAVPRPERRGAVAVRNRPKPARPVVHALRPAAGPVSLHADVVVAEDRLGGVQRQQHVHIIPHRQSPAHGPLVGMRNGQQHVERRLRVPFAFHVPSETAQRIRVSCTPVAAYLDPVLGMRIQAAVAPVLLAARLPLGHQDPVRLGLDGQPAFRLCLFDRYQTKIEYAFTGVVAAAQTEQRRADEHRKSSFVQMDTMPVRQAPPADEHTGVLLRVDV